MKDKKHETYTSFPVEEQINRLFNYNSAKKQEEKHASKSYTK